MTSLRKSVLPGIQPASTQEAPQEAPSAPQVLAGGELPAAPSITATAASVSASDLAGEFQPTAAQVRVKAKFWRQWAEQPLLSAQGAPALALVKQVTNSAAVAAWWGKAGFQDWFLNTQVTDDRVEYLLHLALSAAEDILLNDDPKAAGARVAMIKTVAEMSGKLQRSGPSGADKADAKRRAIDSMSREDIIKMMEGAGLRVERVLTVPASPATPEGDTKQ